MAASSVCAHHGRTKKTADTAIIALMRPIATSFVLHGMLRWRRHSRIVGPNVADPVSIRSSLGEARAKHAAATSTGADRPVTSGATARSLVTGPA